MNLFEKGALREEEFKFEGVKFTLRELRLSERRQIIDAGQDTPIEVVAALTVAMSCPDLDETHIERLVEEVRPEILVAAATRVYQMSGMVEGAKTQTKKPSGSRKGASRSGWLWRWAAPSRN